MRIGFTLILIFAHLPVEQEVLRIRLYEIAQETLASQCVSLTINDFLYKVSRLGDSVSLRGRRDLATCSRTRFLLFPLLSFFIERIRRKSSESSRQTRSTNTMLIDQNPITTMKLKASSCSRLLSEKAFAKRIQPRLVSFFKGILFQSCRKINLLHSPTAVSTLSSNILSI